MARSFSFYFQQGKSTNFLFVFHIVEVKEIEKNEKIVQIGIIFAGLLP
jgi:hypothetical protein